MGDLQVRRLLWIGMAALAVFLVGGVLAFVGEHIGEELMVRLGFVVAEVALWSQIAVIFAGIIVSFRRAIHDGLKSLPRLRLKVVRLFNRNVQ